MCVWKRQEARECVVAEKKRCGERVLKKERVRSGREKETWRESVRGREKERWRYVINAISKFPFHFIRYAKKGHANQEQNKAG